MGYIPHVGMSPFREGHTPTRYIIKDQVAPEHFWGLIHQGPRPRIKPCPKHGYPGPCPGALDISRGFNCLVPEQEPQSRTGGPLGVFTAWSQTRNPSHILGALTRVFCHGTDCLVPDQVPQECTGGPRTQLGSLPSSQRMALATALILTLPLNKRGILSYTKLVTKVYKTLSRTVA
jgi:hypothetical protein